MGEEKKKSGKVLYHGTENRFKIPDPKCFKKDKDFGIGFYLTTSYQQAEKFAQLRLKQSRDAKGYVNQYWIDDTDLDKLIICNIIDNVDWLRYIMFNRGYSDNDIEIQNKFSKYDILCGKVADARINAVLQRYRRGGYNRTARALGVTPEELAIQDLNVEAFENQIVFKTQRAIDCLKFIKAKVIQ